MEYWSVGGMECWSGIRTEMGNGRAGEGEKRGNGERIKEEKRGNGEWARGLRHIRS